MQVRNADSYLELLRTRSFWIMLFLYCCLASPFFFLIGRSLQKYSELNFLVILIATIVWLAVPVFVVFLLKCNALCKMLTFMLISALSWILIHVLLQQWLNVLYVDVIEALVGAPLLAGFAALRLSFRPYDPLYQFYSSITTLAGFLFYIAAVTLLSSAPKLSTRSLKQSFIFILCMVILGLGGCIRNGMLPRELFDLKM